LRSCYRKKESEMRKRKIQYLSVVVLLLVGGLFEVFAQAPAVTNTDPVRAATQVDVSQDVSVWFDQVMDGSTLNADTFKLYSTFAGTRDGVISFNATTNQVAFNPTNDFYPGERVFVDLTRGITNAGGSDVLPHQIWSFYAETERAAGLLGYSGQDFGLSSVYNVTLSDLDLDGTLDLITSEMGGNSRIFTNDGTGTFYDDGQDFDYNRDIAVGDLNGDGWPDLFCGGTSVSRVYTNDGNGVFSDTGQSLANNLNHGVLLADFNGDGDLDAFVMNQYDHCKVWTNDGTGNFFDSGQSISTNTRGGAVGDLTGNGYLDVVVSSGAGVRIYTNDGLGVFTYDGQELITATSYNPDIGDVNGDGYLDVLVARYGGDSRVFTNNGSGVLSATGQNLYGYNVTDGRFGDMNGDGLLDVVLYGIGFGTYIYTNDGSAMFYQNDRLLGGNGDGSMALGDLDGDGDLDVARGNITASGVYVLLNQYPSLAVLSADDSPIENNVSASLLLGTDFGDVPAGASYTNSFIVTNAADVLLSISGTTSNGDGATNFRVLDMPQLVTGGMAQAFSIRFSPDAQGVFTAQVVIANSSTNGAYVINLAGTGGAPLVTNTSPENAAIDVRLDAPVMAEFDAPMMASTITTNTFMLYSGQSGFRPGAISYGAGNWNATTTPNVPFRPGELFFAEIAHGISNATGSVELKTHAWSFYAAAAGSAQMDVSAQNTGTNATQLVALGDLDGDGDLDALLVNFSGEADQIWTNEGGVFYDSGQSLGSEDGRFGALGDVDNDGDLDAYIVNWQQPDKVWLNNGHGVFADSGQTLGSGNSRHVSLADLDSDGDLDAYCVLQSETDQVWINTGSGTFIDSSQVLSDSYGLGAMLGDLNNDGSLDVFIVNWNQPEQVWTNDGAGNFYNSGQALGTGYSRDVGLADLNGDGAMDAFVARDNNGANKVWLNNGSGTFSDSGQSLGTSRSRGVTMGDLDGDGDIDAYVANYGQANAVWLNDGQGSFFRDSVTSEINNSWRAALGDVNGDGCLDVFVANEGASCSLSLNATPDLYVLGIDDEVIANNVAATVAAGTDFGQVNQGEPISHTLALTNAGTVALAIHAVTTNGSDYFSVAGIPAYVEAGSISNFQVHFNAASPGVYTAVVCMLNNSTNDPFYLNLTADCIPPSVTNTIPAGGQVHVAKDAEITAQFNTNMLVSTITSNTFFLCAEQSGYHRGGITVAYSGMEAILDPDVDLFPGERVTGALTKGITNDAGTMDMAYHLWSFNAAVAPGGGVVTEQQRIGPWNSDEAELGDLNNDGYLDVFIPAYSAYSHVLLNDGTGQFYTNQTFERWAYPMDVALGDVDNDGDLDAFVTRNTYRRDEVWTNNGSGIFYDSGQTLGSNDNTGVSLGDVDGDGDLDAFVVTSSDKPGTVWLNDGAGTFTDSGQALDGGAARAVALADFDGDGDLDAFEVTTETNRVWVNNGEGVFHDSGQRLGDNYGSSLAIGDVNGDGYIDTFICNGWDDEVIWLNDGAGVFTNSGQTFSSDYCTGVELGDLDGDGDLDAITCYLNSDEDRIWRNDGTGQFSDSGQRLGAVSTDGVAAGDFDGDGRLDLYILGAYNAVDYVWMNTVPEMHVLGVNGADLVSDERPSTAKGTDFGYQLIHDSVSHIFSITNAGSVDLLITDVMTNGGGAGSFAVSNIPSLVLAGTISNFNVTYHAVVSGLSTMVLSLVNSSSNMLFEINLQGVACESLLTNTIPLPAAVAVPMDSSVTAQFFQPMMGSTLTANTFLLNGEQTGPRSGSISFNAATNEVTLNPAADFMPGELMTAELTHGITNAAGTVTLKSFIWQFFADVDGGSGYLTNNSMSTCGAGSYAAALGDLNFDGALDVYVAIRGGANQVWTNDGSGTLYDSGQRMGSGASRAVELGDIDNDDDLDAFVVNPSEPDRIWTNDGTGVFGDSGQALTVSAGLGVKLGDLDGDGNLDAYVINQNQPNRVWTNDGAGIFYDSAQLLGTNDSRGLAMGDVDNDGDLDVFVVNADSTDYLWWNDGNGFFTNRTAISTNNGRDVAMGDLNGDGYLDMFVSNLGHPDRVWTNDGTGMFRDSGQRLGNNLGRGVALGDMNNDGALDAFAVNRNEPNVLWLNDGTGQFIDSGLALGSAYNWWPSIGDLDGDGDLDVYVPTQDGADEVWFNAQLHTILATYGIYGTIMPSGIVEVIDGQSTSFVVTATEYCHIDPLLTNGAEDAVASGMAIYTSKWNNVSATGQIHAAFSADLAALGTPYWWLASYNLTNSGVSFNQAEVADTDYDEFNAGDEYIADTNPTDSNSFFAVTAISNTASYSVFFHSSSNRNYSMEYTDQLVTGLWNGVQSQTNISGSGTTMSLTDTNETATRAYRAGVKLKK